MSLLENIKFDINDKKMIENIIYNPHHSSTMIFSIIFQQSPFLALMANQTDQLIKLINLVIIILVCQKEIFLSIHISLFVSHLPLLLIQTISLICHPDFSILFLPLSHYFLSSFPLYI